MRGLLVKAAASSSSKGRDLTMLNMNSVPACSGPTWKPALFLPRRFPLMKAFQGAASEPNTFTLDGIFPATHPISWNVLLAKHTFPTCVR